MITIDEKLFWEAYKEAMGSNEVTLLETIPKNLESWLTANIVHKDFLNFIIRYPFQGDVQLCANYFYGPALIMKSTEEYKTIKKEYLVIGSSSNGDFIVLPRSTWETIGYISHDEFGYDESDLLKYCPVSKKSIGEFYFNTWHIKDYPCDYYEALRNKQSLVQC
jgi:hypothetical protein